MIRALTTVYNFMFYQTTLVDVCLITHITNIRALTTVYAFVLYQATLMTVCLITHITNIRALTSVYVYGLSDYTCHCMAYYTRHIHKGAQHYAIVDV